MKTTTTTIPITPPLLLLLLLTSNHKLNALSTTSPGSGFGKTNAPLSYSVDTSSSTASLLSFLNSNNIKTAGKTAIGVSKTGQGGLGLYATKSFKKDEIICQIPSDFALALSNPEFGGNDAPTLAHCGRNFLSFYEDNEQARVMWDFYLGTLPEGTTSPRFEATPDFFPRDEIDALEFPRLVAHATERQRQVDELAGEEGIDVDRLRFATWIAGSRSIEVALSEEPVDNEPLAEGNSIVTKNTKSVRVLVPYLDMINHSSNHANAEQFIIDPEKDDAWFAVRAKRRIPEGKEITVGYGRGRHSSDELLLNYGFVPAENKIDSLMLRKGGEGVYGSVNEWSTTLEEDLKMLEGGDGLTENMRKVLELRIQLKKSY